MNPRALKNATRLAAVRERIADQARARLVRHDSDTRLVEQSIQRQAKARVRESGVLSPPPGETLDPTSTTAGLVLGELIARDVQAKKEQLVERKSERKRIQTDVQLKSVESERAEMTRQRVKDQVRTVQNARDVKTLDEMASRRRRRQY